MAFVLAAQFLVIWYGAVQWRGMLLAQDAIAVQINRARKEILWQMRGGPPVSKADCCEHAR